MNNGKEKLLHNCNNYFYGQKSLTQMCLELLANNQIEILKKTLELMHNQQEEHIEKMLSEIKLVMEH